jgi:hypothetical protein
MNFQWHAIIALNEICQIPHPRIHISLIEVNIC